jgi:hypothetical protein
LVKSQGGERYGKGATRSRHVSIEETNASEPLMKCRNSIGEIKTEGFRHFRDKSGGQPAYCPDGLRHKSGVNLIEALVWNLRTCSMMVREKAQAEDP